jgi:prepilin-type N-terminal cleavage/methylation domain-containing protein
VRKYLSSGFTLVELLIVIAILGVIATVVIAAINPIEQANRARDSKYRADASQLLSATERYFVSQSSFPWVTSGEVADNDAAFGFVPAYNLGVGVCKTTSDCSDGTIAKQGTLITANEVKTEFMGRDFIKAFLTPNDASKQLMVGKSGGATGSGGGSESVYACYIPAASSNRQSACAASKVYTLSTTTGTRSVVPKTTCELAAATAWTTNKWYVCIPE